MLQLNNDAEPIKIVLLGDSSVGKTCIIQRFIHGDQNIDNNYSATQGVQFYSKMYTLENGIQYNFKIWDTAGQEKYRSINSIYYREAKIAILVYDITNKKSFDTLQYWAQEVRQKSKENTILAVVGNKQDLHQNEQVDYNESQEYSRVPYISQNIVNFFKLQEIGALFKLTSAKEGKGIDDLFRDIVNDLEQKEFEINKQKAFQLRNQNNDFEKRKQMIQAQNMERQQKRLKKEQKRKKKEKCC